VLTLRPVEIGDIDFLWRMLFRASWSHLDEGSTETSIRTRDDLAYYVEDWGRGGDDGVIATGPETGPVGAAWLRLPDASHDPSPSFVADDVPELAIAVEVGYEGRGVGSLLLEGLLVRNGHRTITLTARTTSAAIRLYERFGFGVVEIVTNRVGTQSVKMVRPADRV
jgi:ribosomal protein S18 acetylase RimI-like enzyme